MRIRQAAGLVDWWSLTSGLSFEDVAPKITGSDATLFIFMVTY